MKLSIIKTILSFTVLLGFASCKKTAMNVDPDSLTATVIDMEYIVNGGTTINSGLQYFANGALTYPPTDKADTAVFQVNIAGANALSKDLTVTVGQDVNALKDNYKNDSISYSAMPDSLYHLVTTTATIKAGARVALFTVIFYPSKVDPTQNFMLALTATNTQGIATSSNFGHIYFHSIGNPLAGVYNETGTRYNYNGAITWSGPPAAVPAGYVATTNLSTLSPLLASPDNTHTIEVAFANVGAGYNYIITGNTTYSAISVDFTFDLIYSNIITYVVSYSPPSAGKPAFHLVTHYNNALAGAGNDRIMDQSFVHQ